MQAFIDNIISNIRINDALDILIVSYICYKILGFIKESRAEQLVKGLIVLIVAFFVSDFLNLYTLNWILKSTMTIGAIALVVVFQPELRRGLEYVGRSKLVKPAFSQIGKEKAKLITDEFVKAVSNLSSTRTGALIVLERETALTDIAETGTIIDARISQEMIGNIFYEGAPLHDGAVIVRGDRLYAAGCVLPLTSNKALNKNLGTRHRAGIGITEHSDAISIIVSEETGVISMVQDGKLTRFLDSKSVEKILLRFYLSGEEADDGLLNKLLGRIGGKKKDAK
ncbi:MAG: diadenylate cyclase CdaA [Clostridia bacterium]|nr:diadenylate cyclase CdaA [Clostridia bacterium]